MAPAQPLPRGLPTAILDLLHRRDAPPQPQPGLRAVAGSIAERIAALPHSLSARTLLELPSRVMPARRDTTTETVPGQYHNLNSGPDPGTVVGIVLGSVGGFLLLLWLFYTCMNFGVPPDAPSDVGTASVVTRRSRKSHRRHHHRGSGGGRETVEVRRTSRGPAVIVEEATRDRVVVEEVRRSTSRAPPAPPPPRVIHSDDDDEVVVIEEHSPAPRRHRSSGGHRRHSSSRRESGYRDIDPDRFAGGDAPMRDIRGSSRHGR